MNPEQQSKVWAQIVSKAWADDAFKRRLLTDPAAVLREHGLAMPPDLQVKVVENTEKLFHLTLPNRPGQGELSEEQLDQVAAGKGSALVPDMHG